jgi:recombination protein RecA
VSKLDTMRQEIISILDKLNLPLSKIEKDLGFGNGLLGKIKKEENRSLSEENFQKLKNYFEEHAGVPIPGLSTQNPHNRPNPKMVVTPTGNLSLKPSDEQVKMAQAAIEKLNKDFGAGSVMVMGSKPIGDCETVPTGSIGLDIALGVGGLPRGRVVEVYGPESSGKTTLTLHVIAEAQKWGGVCAFIDAEHAFDAAYAKTIGIDVDSLVLSQPDNGEQALEICDKLISTGAYSVVVIDSVAALTPKAEIEGEMGDSKMGLHARLMSQALRKMTATIHRTGTICIFINQLREKIGIQWGNPETTTGGNALKFYASVRLDVRKIGVLKDGEEMIGNKVRVKVVKNKVAPPFRSAEFDILYGTGINRMGELVDAAVELSVIQKSGSWYSYKESKLGQGRDAVISLLQANPEMAVEIEGKLNK